MSANDSRRWAAQSLRRKAAFSKRKREAEPWNWKYHNDRATWAEEFAREFEIDAKKSPTPRDGGSQ